MKKLVLLFFCTTLYYSVPVFAQNATMKWGPESELPDTEHGLVGKTKDAFYTLQTERKVLMLSKYRTSDMSKVFSKPLKWSEIERKGADDKVDFWTMVQLKAGFILLLTDEDKKNDKEIVYGQSIDFDGNPKGPLLELASRKKVRRSKDGSFGHEISDDSSKLMITEYPIYEKYENEEYKFKIFDANLKITNNFAATFPFKNKDFSLKDYDITNEGIVFMLARIDVPAKEKKKDEESYYYQMVSINANKNGEVKQFDINLDRKYIVEARLFLDKKNNIKCVGVYAEMKDNGKPKDGINGTFYLTIDKTTGKTTSASTKDFSATLIEELSGKKRAKKDKGIESSYDIIKVLDKEDGGTIVIMEDQYVEAVTHCSTSSNGATSCRTVYYYHNEELLIININPAGKIENYITIPKYQVTANDLGVFNSVYATRYKGKTYLLFNDNKLNTGNKFEKSFSKTSKDGIFLLSVTDNGTVSRAPLTTEMEKKKFLLIQPRQTDFIKDNEAIVYGYKFKARCCFGGGKPTVRYGYITIQ